MNKKKIVAIILFIFLGLFIFTFANRGVTPLKDEKPKNDETINTPTDNDKNNSENDNKDNDEVETPVARPNNPVNNQTNPSTIVNNDEEDKNKELKLLKDELIKQLEEYKKDDLNSYTVQNQDFVKDIKETGKKGILNADNIDDAKKFLEEAKNKIDSLDLMSPNLVKLNIDDELETEITNNSVIGTANIYLEANDDSEFKVYINEKEAKYVNTKTTVGDKQIFQIESKLLLKHGKNVLTLVDEMGNETKIEFNVDIESPKATITYSNKNGAAVTKEDVIVTMVTDEAILPLEDWVKVDDKTYTKVITENGKYSVEISDLYGNKTVVKYEVKRIDRINPVITNVSNGGKYNHDVTFGIIEQSIAEITINDKVYNEKNAPRTLIEDGVYKIKVIDKAGNFAELTFAIDKTAPTVTLTTVECNYFYNNACYHNSAVTIKAIAEDINGPLEYSYGDGSNWVLSDTFVKEWTGSNFKVKVRDSFGNVKEETISINIRKDIPNLEFRMNNNVVTTNQVAKNFSPIELKLSSYTQILEYGTLIKNNNDNVTINDIKNSENLKTFKPGMGQTLDKITLPIIDGEYTIWFYYKDFYGNTNLVSSPKFVIDNVMPVISVKEDSIGTISNKTFKKVSFKLFDEYQVKEALLNGVLKPLTPNKWSDFNNITVGSNGAIYGKNTLVLRDLAGNEATYTFTLDNVAPTITVKEESTGSINDKIFKKVSFKLFDDHQIKEVLLNGVLKPLTPNKWSDFNNITVGSNGAVHGENTLVLRDLAGNEATYTFTLDNVAPTITVKEESIGSINDKIFKKVSFKLFDEYQVKEALLNGILKPLTPNKWSDFNNITVGSNGAIYGKNTLVLRDLAGNEATYTFTLDNVAPTVYLLNETTLKLKFGDIYNEYGAYAIDEIDGRVELLKPTVINYYSCDKNLENCVLEESRLDAVDTTRAGLYKVAYTYQDKAGNDSNVRVRLVYIDYIEPVKFNYLSYTTDTSTKVWGHDATIGNPTHKAIVSFKIENKENATELKYIWSNKRIHNELKNNPENYSLLDISNTPDSKGYYSIEYMPNIDDKMILHLYSKDKAGNVTVWGGYETYFKKAIPSIISVSFGDYLLGTLTNQDVTATLNVNSYFDISLYQVSYNNGAWEKTNTNKLVISDNNVKTVKFRIIDTKGTVSAETENYNINIDTVKPLTTNITYAFGSLGFDIFTLKVRIYTSESTLTPIGYTKINEQEYKTEYNLTLKEWLKGTFKRDLVVTDLAGNETIVTLQTELKWPM